ncbi:hypothetical protein GGH98_004859, partial [Coemansia sp. RSA 454]
PWIRAAAVWDAAGVCGKSGWRARRPSGGERRGVCGANISCSVWTAPVGSRAADAGNIPGQWLDEAGAAAAGGIQHATV